MKRMPFLIAVAAPLLLVALVATCPVPAVRAADQPAAQGRVTSLSQSGPSSTASCGGGGAVEGVDVTQGSGSISWTQVAQTKGFAYARANDGDTFTDTSFITNYAGIKNAGMKAGAYLFFEPAQDPTQQANLFLSRLTLAGFASGDLVPMIDVETSGGQISTTIAARLQTAVNVIHAGVHVLPVIYASSTFWNNNVGSTAFSADPFWIASVNNNCPTPPNGWTDWTILQYSFNGSVSGINGPVDLDRSNGPNLPLIPDFKTFLPIILK